MSSELPDFFATPSGAIGIALAEAIAWRLMDPSAPAVATQFRPAFQQAIEQRRDELVAMDAPHREEIRVRCVEWHDGTADIPPTRPTVYFIALYDAQRDGGPELAAPPVRQTACLYLIMR